MRRQKSIGRQNQKGNVGKLEKVKRSMKSMKSRKSWKNWKSRKNMVQIDGSKKTRPKRRGQKDGLK